MRNVVSAIIGLLWGGWMLVYRMRNGFDDVPGAYRNGQYIGFVFGLLMFGGGCYYAYRTVEEFQDRPRRRKPLVDLPEEAKSSPAKLRSRHLTSGIVGILFGGFIVFNFLNQPAGTGSYRTGQWIGLLLGVLMLCGGGYYLWKVYGDSSPTQSKPKRAKNMPSAPSARRQPPPPAGVSRLPPRRSGS